MRSAKDRVRSATQLVRHFFWLLIPYRYQTFWILASATAATMIGLLPPAGTKFVIDYGPSRKTLPAPSLLWFPSLANPKQLPLLTVVAVSLISLLKILIQVWGRWYCDEDLEAKRVRKLAGQRRDRASEMLMPSHAAALGDDDF